MGSEKKNLVVLIFNHNGIFSFKVVSLRKAVNDLKIKIAIDENGKTLIMQSQKKPSGLRASIGQGFDERMMSEHFKKDIPLGIFDKTNIKHLNTMTGVVKNLTESIMV